MTNHPNRNRNKQQQPTHTPDTSTKRMWEELAHEAIADAGEWKRQCRDLQALNAELLAALKDCAEYFSDFVETDYTEAKLQRAALNAIVKAEGR